MGSTSPTSAPSAEIRWLICDDVAWVLQLTTGEVLAMDGVACCFWNSLVCGQDEATAVEVATSRFDVPSDRVTADYREFRRSCLHRGLLTESATLPLFHDDAVLSGAAPPLRSRLPAWMHALSCRLRVRAAQRQAGFAGVYRLARQAARLSPHATRDSGDPDDARRTQSIDAVLQAFVRAEGAVSVGRGIQDCLPRSVSLFVLLRERGIPATHIIAITPRPFVGHAYVEIDGVPVLEDTKRLQFFGPLAVLPVPPATLREPTT